MSVLGKIRFSLLVALALQCPVTMAQGQKTASRSADQAGTRAAFLKMIDRPRVALAPQHEVLEANGSWERQRFTFAAEAGQRVPGILVKRAGSTGRRPAVIALHGTGGNKESQEPLLKELAQRGFLGVAIDGRHHGERAKGAAGATAYSDAILRAYRTGKEHPFLYDTVWDVLRLIDYLETRDDVDAKRIALIGFSKGGMETYLAAAADARVAAAVPCIGVQSFAWALEHDAWQSRVSTFRSALDAAARDAGNVQVDADFVRHFYDRVVPGIYSQFDGPQMLPLIAPRPLLVIVGEQDARTPLPGVLECADRARKAYAAAQAAAKFVLWVQPKTGHQVTPQAQRDALAWLVQELRP